MHFSVPYRMLSEFLGVHSLLLIISRTQRGISALEEYDEQGNVIEHRGLHGLARHLGFTISGRYDTLALTDIRYTACHRQRRLNAWT